MNAPHTGLTLVLVHGAGSAATIWDRVTAALDQRWSVLVPNLPGHGGEPRPGRPSIDAYATWLEAYLASQTEGSVVLGGHSMGGAIAQLVALRRRAELSGLILLSTGARLRVAPEFLAGLQTDFEGTLRQSADLAFATASPFELRLENQAHLEQAGPAVVHDDFAACDVFDVASRLREIELPTLVLCGIDDQMTPPRYSQLLASTLGDARLKLIPGAGHMLPIEQPAVTAAEIDDFLSDLNGDG